MCDAALPMVARDRHASSRVWLTITGPPPLVFLKVFIQRKEAPCKSCAMKQFQGAFELHILKELQNLLWDAEFWGGKRVGWGRMERGMATNS